MSVTFPKRVLDSFPHLRFQFLHGHTIEVFSRMIKKLFFVQPSEAPTLIVEILHSLFSVDFLGVPSAKQTFGHELQWSVSQDVFSAALKTRLYTVWLAGVRPWVVQFLRLLVLSEANICVDIVK